MTSEDMKTDKVRVSGYITDHELTNGNLNIELKNDNEMGSIKAKVLNWTTREIIGNCEVSCHEV